MATPHAVPMRPDGLTKYKISIDLIIQDTQANTKYDFRDYIEVSQALLGALNNIEAIHDDGYIDIPTIFDNQDDFDGVLHEITNHHNETQTIKNITIYEPRSFN